jgi:hypothetical protein
MIGSKPPMPNMCRMPKPLRLKPWCIRYWIYRHLHCEVSQVISALADAVDFARAHDRDIILPEWPSKGAEKPE